MISIFADGSSTGQKNAPGGYGWIIIKDEETIVAWGYGGSPKTTNNLMELEGVIQGLTALLEIYPDCQDLGYIEVVSDSQYAVGMASGVYAPTKNLDTVRELRRLMKETGAKARWVKGHAGDKYNEICDQLAKQGKTENSAKTKEKRKT